MGNESIAYQIVGASVSGIVISTLAIILRIWSRATATIFTFWWDDYFAILGWMAAVGNCIVPLYWIHLGLGRHMADNLAAGITSSDALVPLFYQDFPYNAGTCLTKLSAIAFYARMFSILPRLRIALWVGVALVVALYITLTVGSTTACTPVRKEWEVNIPGHCASRQATFIAAATPNVFIDLYILLLPIPAIWPLSMEMSRRLAVLGVFTMGYGVMVVSILRLVSVVQFSRTGGVDLTWTWVYPDVLLTIEPWLSVVCVSLPSILQLLRRGTHQGWRSVTRTGRREQSFLDSLSFRPPSLDGRTTLSESSRSVGQSTSSLDNRDRGKSTTTTADSGIELDNSYIESGQWTGSHGAHDTYPPG